MMGYYSSCQPCVLYNRQQTLVFNMQHLPQSYAKQHWMVLSYTMTALTLTLKKVSTLRSETNYGPEAWVDCDHTTHIVVEAVILY